jgi:TetR/AcrR family transcriptional repressor of mexJK operon
MDAVAAAAGVSKLTVYSHFTDKQTLFCSAVMATCQIQLPDLLFEYPRGTGGRSAADHCPWLPGADQQ